MQETGLGRKADAWPAGYAGLSTTTLRGLYALFAGSDHAQVDRACIVFPKPEGPRHLWEKHLPQLPGRLRAVLALWVEGTLLGANGCQDTVTLALAQGLRGPRHPHTLRRLQRELLYDDADRIGSWGPGQELEVEGCFAPLLQWVRRGWVPTGGRELA